MQRDWNEELQSCREFPHTTPQKRILRDRALYKVTSDFVDAAISGATGVINRCIPPINPTDPECFHIVFCQAFFKVVNTQYVLDGSGGRSLMPRNSCINIKGCRQCSKIGQLAEERCNGMEPWTSMIVCLAMHEHAAEALHTCRMQKGASVINLDQMHEFYVLVAVNI